MVLSKRKNGTYRAAAAGGWNPYGWGNGKGRKKPREVRTHSGKYEKTLQAHDITRAERNQEGEKNEISV
jgi:hypothetical protein